MKTVTVAAIQMRMTDNREENINNAKRLVISAAKQGAQIILLPELFERPYFCQERRYKYYSFAEPIEENKAVKELSVIAKEYGVVLPLSIYERDGLNLYNTVVVVDDEGKKMGIYRKTHIPDDHYYQEKFYFVPGNTGFRVWKTKYATIGVGICWDQWFPECARTMTLMGAELLFYPTAIGSEPILQCDSMPHWMRAMQGHSASNIIPVIAANRYGEETVKPCDENGGQSSSLLFYGSSFMTDDTGSVIKQAERQREEILIHTYNIDQMNEDRLSWGVFRDRRPDRYDEIVK